MNESEVRGDNTISNFTTKFGLSHKSLLHLALILFQSRCWNCEGNSTTFTSITPCLENKWILSYILSCYLAVYTHTCKAPHWWTIHTCHRTNGHITCVFHTCEHVNHHICLTRANTHVWYNALHTCTPMPSVQLRSHALSHLHHASSSACAQLIHIYTVMSKMILTPPPKP